MKPDPRVVWMPGAVRTEIHLAGEHTDGAFCLLIDEPPAGWSLPAHLHRGVAETIHILAGAFEVTIDGRSHRLDAGQTAHIPPDVVHSSVNLAAAVGRRVIVFSPAGMEDLFLEVGAASPDGEIDTRGALAAAARHGWKFIASSR